MYNNSSFAFSRILFLHFNNSFVVRRVSFKFCLCSIFLSKSFLYSSFNSFVGALEIFSFVLITYCLLYSILFSNLFLKAFNFTLSCSIFVSKKLLVVPGTSVCLNTLCKWSILVNIHSISK